MAGSRRQQMFNDPNPSNLGNVAGIPPFLVMTTLTPTLAGSTILVHACVANLSGNFVDKVKDSVNGFYTPARRIDNPTNGLSNGLWYKQNAAALGVGDHGSVTSGTSTSLTDTSKNWTGVNFTGKTVLEYSSGNSWTVTSNTATVLNFSAGATPVAGNLYVVGDYISVIMSNSDDYNAGHAEEWTGVAANSVVDHNMTATDIPVSGGVVGPNCVTTGLIVLGPDPCTLIGHCTNDVDGGSTPFVPTIGQGLGYSDDGTMWIFDVGAPIARLQSVYIPNPLALPSLTLDMKFTAQHPDNFQANVIALRDAPVATSQVGPSNRWRRRWSGESMGLNIKEWW